MDQSRRSGAQPMWIPTCACELSKAWVAVTSTAMTVPGLIRLRGGGPGRHVFLGRTKERREGDAKKTKRDDGHEHFVHLISGCGAHDEIADARDRSIEIRQHHADEAAPKRKPQSRDDERQRRGEDDIEPQLALRAAERAPDL